MMLKKELRSVLFLEMKILKNIILVKAIFCDVEGDEDSLLDPQASEVLKKFDIIVEIHEF